MIVGISKQKSLRQARVVLKIIIVLIIMLLALSKLFSELWNLNSYFPKTREEQYIERPLRVLSSFVKII
ncbi:MAG: hypothetical protein H6Q74_606 [Firmicutes bacterium]|nr:hypothetical protein [Bacillota bacterium]